MRIPIAVSGFAFLALGFAALPAHAQTLNIVQPLQPQPSRPLDAAPAMPFVYSAPIPPVAAPTTAVSPIQPFVESPVGPYGKPATPMAPPAAPVTGTASTPLVPNGVMLSNGAIVTRNTASSAAIPSPNRAFPQEQQLLPPPVPNVLDAGQIFFTPDAESSNRGRGRNSGNDANTSALAPAPPPAPSLAPVAPPITNQPSRRNGTPNRTAEAAEIPAGTSLRDLIEQLGQPVVTVNQDSGQRVYFNGGFSAFVQNGVVQ